LFCRAHGAHTTSDPAGTLAFKCTDPSRVQRYRFAGRLADFFICSECGVYLGARLETAKGAIGILNINTLRPLPAPLPAPEPMDYGGESAEARQLRRSTHWTPLAPESL